MMNEEPHSSPYEMSAIALMLQYPETAGAVIRASLSPDSFYIAAHRQLFEAIKEHHQEGEIAILDKAMRSRAFSASGGENLFDKLKATKVSEKKKDEVLSKLSELLCCRRLIKGCPSIVEAAYSGDYEAANAQLGVTLDDLSKTVRHEDRGSHIKDCLDDVVGDVHKIASGTESICRPIGLPQLDAKTGGLMNELIMISGPTSSGKSALSNQYILANCLDHKRPGVVFSFEMDKKTVTKRMIAYLSGVSLSKLMGINPDGGPVKFRKDELLAIKGSIERLSECQLFIEDDSTLSIEDIWSRCTEIKASCGDLGAVCIDYCQIMGDSKLAKGVSREGMVSHQGKKAKQLQKHLGCPVLLLSQMAQDFTARESKALEQHAGIWLRVLRGEDMRTGEQMKDECIQIWKCRHAERFGKINIGFDGPRQKFYER